MNVAVFKLYFIYIVNSYIIIVYRIVTECGFV